MLALIFFMPLAAQAAISWGSASGQTYQMTYDQQIYGTGTEGSLAFCQKWRLACIDYVGPLNYHHVVSCGADQKGPTIFNVCAALKKDEQGNWTGSKTACDFTEQVIGRIDGATIVSQPSSPYAACDPGANPPAGTGSDESGATSDAAASSSSTTSRGVAQTTTTSTVTTSAGDGTITILPTTSDSAPTATDDVVVASTTVTSSFSPSSVGAAPSASGGINPFAQQDGGDSSSAAQSLVASSALLIGLLALPAWL